MGDNFGLEDLGDMVQDIVNSAVSSKDYKQLNNMINEALDKAIENGTQALKDALAPRPSGEAYKQYRYTPPESFQQKRTERKEEKQLYAKVGGDRAMGGFFAGAGGLLAAGCALGIIANGMIQAIIDAGTISPLQIFLAVFFAAGAALSFYGGRLFGRTTRFRKYVKTLGTKTYCDVNALAKVAGKPVKYVRKDVKQMIDKGWFMEGHLDEKETTLVTSDETWKQYQELQKQQEEKRRQEAIANAKKPTMTPEAEEIIDKGNEYLRQIHECNDRIPGEDISAQIAGIEDLVGTILERAKEHPEAASGMKKMMNYYLPMTIKLLNAYEEMDRQPVQGENIKSAKKEIEETLTTLNQAFEKLLDSSFGETALDVSSDISVLNTLLAQEGLKEDGLQAAAQARY